MNVVAQYIMLFWTRRFRELSPGRRRRGGGGGGWDGEGEGGGGGGGEEGYFLLWPIRGGSARKGYLFQPLGLWKGGDFTSWRICMRFLMQYKIHAKGRHLTKNTQHICTTQANGLFQFQIYRISMWDKGRGGVGQGAWSQSRVTTWPTLLNPFQGTEPLSPRAIVALMTIFKQSPKVLLTVSLSRHICARDNYSRENDCYDRKFGKTTTKKKSLVKKYS